MSTRANIRIKDEYDEVLFYRHSDGYPAGALPTLQKFLQWVDEGRIRDNVSQASGWLIMIGAAEYDKRYDGNAWVPKETLLEPPLPADSFSWKVGAYEPATQLYPDIEYLYVVDLAARQIEVYHTSYDWDASERTLEPIGVYGPRSEVPA